MIARRDPRRHPSVAARWLECYLEERPDATIDDAAMVAGCLSALRGGGHDEASALLRAVAERGSRKWTRGPLPRVTRDHDPKGVEAVAPLQQSSLGGSGSFLVRADDGERYWCKTLNNLQNEPRVPGNEQLVARLGILIGAPVCAPELVYIPSALVGWEIRPGSGRLLEEGWAHGSRAVDLAVETHDISANRTTDDNARRHAGLYGLYDLCGGADPQWLMAGTEGEFHSHDHGMYFPGGPNWTPASLQAAAATPYVLPAPPTGLDPDELARLADGLEELTEQDIEAVASKIPTDWPVQDDELEALVGFVDVRRPQVAQRLRDLVAAV